MLCPVALQRQKFATEWRRTGNMEKKTFKKVKKNMTYSEGEAYKLERSNCSLIEVFVYAHTWGQRLRISAA